MARLRLRPKGSNKLRRKCDNCEIRFHSHFCLYLHLTVHSKDRAGWFQCGICRKRFERLVNFIKHRSRHGNGRRQHKAVDVTELVDIQHRTDEDVEGKGDTPSFQVMKEDVSSEYGESSCSVNTMLNPEQKIKEEETKRNAFAIKFVEQLKDLLKLDEDSIEQIQEDKTESLQFSEVTSSNIPHDGFLSPSRSSPLSENAQEWQGNTQDQIIKNLRDPGSMVCEIENKSVAAENKMDCEPENNEIASKNDMDCQLGNAEVSSENKIVSETENNEILAINRIDCETEHTKFASDNGMDCEPENNQISAENEMDCETDHTKISPENKMNCEPGNNCISPESKIDCEIENNEFSALNKVDCGTEHTKISSENKMDSEPGNNQISAENEMDCGTENKEILAESNAHRFDDQVTGSEANNVCMSKSDGKMSPKAGVSANMKIEGDEKEINNSRPTNSSEGKEGTESSRLTNSSEIKKEIENSRPSKSDRSKISSLASPKRGSFTCFLCKAKFPGYAGLYKHKKTEHQITKTKSVQGVSNRSLNCFVCKMTFATYSGLYSHRKSAHKSKSTLTSSNQLSKNKHKIKVEKITAIKEEKVSSKKLQPKKEKADIQSQLGQPYQCRFCIEGFTSFNALSQHMRKVHKCYRRLDKDKNLFKRENLGPDSDSGNELFKKDAIDIAANRLGSTAFGKTGDASLLACSLCTGTFFTYSGLKGHLRTKHNVGVAVKPKDSEPKPIDDKKDANPGNKGESSVQIDKIPEAVRKADVKAGSACSKSPSSGKEEEDGYFSDNNKSCKKCDKSFVNVKDRRQHALKSHGIEVSFEGEKFIFVEYNLSGDAKTDQNEVKRSNNQSNDSANCSSQLLKCNICSAEYTKMNSYRKHMFHKHYIRVNAHGNEIERSNDQSNGSANCSSQLLKCSLCSAEYTKKNSYHKHMFYKHDIRMNRRVTSTISTHTVSESSSDSIRSQKALGDHGTRRSFTPTNNDTFGDITGAGSTKIVRTDSAKVRPSSTNLLTKGDKQDNNNKLQLKEPPECATISSRPEHPKSPSSLLINERKESASKEDDKLEASLWRTDLAKKKFDCFICGSQFAGYRVQRMHMIEYHDINLDKNGKRIKPERTKPKGIDTSFDKYRKKMFASFNEEVVSNGEESSSEESKDVDSAMSDTEEGANSQTEETFTLASPDKNNKGKYLCPQCPMDFVTLIDRHIHMKDTHRKIQDLRRRTQDKEFGMSLKASSVSQQNIADTEYISRGSTPVSSIFGSDEDEEVAASFKQDNKVTAKSSPTIKQHEATESKTKTNPRDGNGASRRGDGDKPDETIQTAVKNENSNSLTPYVCGYCDKAHSTCGSLVQHFQEAHHVRPKDSAERGKFTNQKNSSYHDREKPFVCGICNTRMSVKKSIQQHMKKKHGRLLLPQNNRARKSVTPLKKAPQNENKHADNVRSSLLAISIDEAGKEPVRQQICDDPMVLSADTEDEKMDGKFSPVPPGNDTEDDDLCYDNIDNTLRNLFDLALIDCSNEPGVSTVTCPEVAEAGELDGNCEGAIGTALDFNSNADSTASAHMIKEPEDFDKGPFGKGDKSVRELILIDVNAVKQEFPVDHVRKVPHNNNTTARKVQLREEIIVIDSSEDEGEEVNVVDTDNDFGDMPKLIPIEEIQGAAEEVQQDAVEIQPEDNTETTIFKCSVCNIELPSSQQLQLHKIRVSHHSGFVCKIAGCGKEFSSKGSYNDHIRYRCPLCHKRLSSVQKVKRHIREVHRIKDTLTCDVCGEEFVEPISLAYHNRERHMTEQVS